MSVFEQLCYELTSCLVLVEGEPVVLRDVGDGKYSVVLYCDGDVELSYSELRTIVRLLDKFMYERERLGQS